MRDRWGKYGVPLLVAGMSLATVGAAHASNAIDFTLEAGAEYNDNITIDSIDSTSRQGDSMLRFNGSVSGDVFKKDDTSLSGRYSFFQSLHQDLTAFDLQIHGLSARFKTKTGKVTLGGSYRYDHIRLDGDGFLGVHSVGPDIGLLIAKKTYLTASYEYRHQTFANPLRSERNADRHSLDAKLYFLLGGGENITAGYKVSRQTAGVDNLSYWGHTFDAGYKKPFKLAGTEATLRLRYQYRQRDYSAIEPQIGEIRQDKRHTVRVGLDVPLTKKMTLGAEYKYVAALSNLPVADYKGNSVRASLGWSF